MSWVQIAVLAMVQGLTEFLPVSSSAHLILVSGLAGWPDQGLAMDVAVHLGTLLAVLFYFRGDVGGLVSAWWRPATAAETRRQRQLGLLVIVASAPVLLVGWLAYGLVEGQLRHMGIITAATLVFALLLLIADRRGASTRRLGDLRGRDGLLIGLAQVLALIPGASRSGVTIMMGRALGFEARAAARFSFLLSIPVIVAASGHGLYRMLDQAVPVAWSQLLVAVVLAAVAGWACIAAFLALLSRVGLLPFIIYRFGVGLALVIFLLMH